MSTGPVGDALSQLRVLAEQMRGQARTIDHIAATLDGILGDHSGQLALIAKVIGEQGLAVERVGLSLDALLSRAGGHDGSV